MNEMNAIREKLQAFQGPVTEPGEKRRTLMSLTFNLKAGKSRKLRSQELVMIVDGCVKNPQGYPWSEWDQTTPLLWETGGTIEAVVDSTVTIIYL